jgi:hypothetical protein
MSRSFRLSHSAIKTLGLCERKFQLERILSGQKEHEDYPATVLGKAWGAAVASYFVHQDQDKAIYDLWLSYYPRLEDDVRTQEVAINMLVASFGEIDSLLQDWEVWHVEGKPAVELSFRLNLDSSYYFVGYVDIVLKNRYTGRAAVLDVKTTGLKLFDLSPVYQNSPQCIGYSIVLDQIMGEELAEYDVFYFSGQLGSGNGFSPIIKSYVFPKTLQDRLHWFISLGMDVKHLEDMAEMNVYPQRGDNCLQYKKPCKHFGTCSLYGLDRPAEEEEDTTEYQFVFSLEEIIENHIRRMPQELANV